MIPALFQKFRIADEDSKHQLEGVIQRNQTLYEEKRQKSIYLKALEVLVLEVSYKYNEIGILVLRGVYMTFVRTNWVKEEEKNRREERNLNFYTAFPMAFNKFKPYTWRVEKPLDRSNNVSEAEYIQTKQLTFNKSPQGRISSGAKPIKAKQSTIDTWVQQRPSLSSATNYQYPLCFFLTKSVSSLVINFFFYFFISYSVFRFFKFI